jgi:hypothetical protein
VQGLHVPAPAELLVGEYAAQHGLQLEIWHRCSCCSCCAGSGGSSIGCTGTSRGGHSTCAMLTSAAGGGSACVVARGVAHVSGCASNAFRWAAGCGAAPSRLRALGITTWPPRAGRAGRL